MKLIIERLIGDVKLSIFAEKKNFYANYMCKLTKSIDNIFQFDFISTLPIDEKEEVIVGWILEDVITWWETPDNKDDYFYSYSMNTDNIDVEELLSVHETVIKKKKTLQSIVNQDWIDSVKTWQKLIGN